MSGSTPSKLTVAIVGATGDLGSSVTKAFLDLYPETFNRVIILTRNPQSDGAKALEALGAELLQTNGPIYAGALKGVDVLVNAAGPGINPEENDALVKEAVASGARLYFPSEFGMDHRYGPQNHVWFHEKERHVGAARNLAHDQLKVIKVYIGMFTEIIFSAFLGFDTENGIYTSLGTGTSDKKIAITSTADIGASVARLSILAAADPKSVPDDVRISGDNKSINELAEIVSKATGKTIKVVEEPVVEGADDKDGEDMADLARLLRLNFSHGATDFSKDNDNELVNPGQKYWTWKTTEVYARDVLAKQ
ncbi:hypothetical protein FRB96_004283 [Tulasnella sp. 330]|nr:hypothetical protein FRB96_004283 [Tulasnella sp. 330]KAG8889206.1 hypothetical protein FRB98_005399 [Tulasnella sp. 332]